MKKKIRGLKRSTFELDFDLYRVNVPIKNNPGFHLSVIDLSPEFVEQTIVFQHAAEVMDKVKIYETQIYACMGQNKLLEAIQIAIEALKLLNVRLPEKPTKLHILFSLIKLYKNYRKQKEE